MTFNNKGSMKRKNNLYEQIYSIANIELADQKARKGKSKQPGVIEFAKNRNTNILLLHNVFKNMTYKTSDYKTFTINEPKERLIFRLPYFPDRLAHHAIMNIVGPVLGSTFTADTYSCIEGRGIHANSIALQKALKDIPGTQYCLKLDIKKFYPSVNHEILKKLLRKKIKDNDLLWLLDGIIDSAPGLPIGNYLSQYFAIFYLSYFDHWIKEKLGVKYYFRYMDDMVILSDNKAFLHNILAQIKEYLDKELKLTIKENYQVFPVSARGIDVVGYVFFSRLYLPKKNDKKTICS